MLSFVVGVVLFVIGVVILVIRVARVLGAQKLLDLMLRILEFKHVKGIQDGLGLLDLVIRGELQEVAQVVGSPFDIFDPDSGQGHLKVHLLCG
jgi:hypothetical protein